MWANVGNQSEQSQNKRAEVSPLLGLADVSANRYKELEACQKRVHTSKECRCKLLS